MKRYHPDTALVATSALKLIDKYQADDLRDRVVRHIEADWPQSPLEWIALYRMRQTYAELNKFHKELRFDTPLEEKFPEPASAIWLARECNVPSILPAAFLAMVGIEYYQDWDEIRNDDRNLDFYTRSARWKLLSKADYDRVDHGTAELLARCLVVRAKVFEVPADICQRTALDCREELKYRLHNQKYDQREPEAKVNPMAVMQKIEEEIREFDLCDSCKEHIRLNIAQAMQECWEELPIIFNLNGD